MDFYQWPSSPSGRHILQAETAWITRQLSDVNRNQLLQIGCHFEDNFSHSTQNNPFLRVFYLGEQPRIGLKKPYICAKFDAMPVRSASMDVVLALHALERVKNMNKVVADMHRLLKPEGLLVVTGFQRFGLWRLWHYFFGQKLFPRHTHFYSVDHVVNLLESQGFTVMQQQTACFQLPSFKQKRFVETIGQLLLPYCGAVYMITAIKKERGVTPLFEPLFVWEK